MHAPADAEIRASGPRSHGRFIAADPEVNDRVADAYRARYARNPTYVDPMLADEAQQTTPRLAS